MPLKQHVVQASFFSLLFVPYLGVETLVVFLSMILIDLDHYLDYVVVCRRFSLRNMFRFHNWLWEKRTSVYAISLFHTLEVFLSLFLLGFLHHYFWLVLYGFLIHYLFDLYFLYKNGCLCVRAFSIVEYFLKKGDKGYPLPESIFWNKTG